MKNSRTISQRKADFDSWYFTLFKIVSRLSVFAYNTFYGMHIHPTALISHSAILDKTHARGIHIGSRSFVTGRVIILAHDFSRSIRCDTIIGSNVFIGVNSVIMPGVKIGNNVIIGSGSVVTGHIPSNCIAVGNPCVVINDRADIIEYGKLRDYT
jgi:acetyltransferase-like isoleucine patch superfamily enzyme